MDQFANLRSRLGHNSLATGLGNVNSILTANGIRYEGGGTSLLRVTTSIATGFDGNPLGLVSWRGYLLCTNKSNPSGFNSPVKDNGTTLTRWLPAAPTVAPTIAKQPEKATTVASFDNSETWTPSAGATTAFDASDKQAGTHSLKVSFTDPATYTVSRAVTVSLDSVGAVAGTDDDKHRIWVKVTDFKQVGAIALIVDVSAANDYQTDFYRAEIPRKKFKQAKGAWVLLELRRAASVMDVLVVDPNQIDILRNIVNVELQGRAAREWGDLPVATQNLVSQEALTFTRVGATAGRDWSTVTGVRLEIEARGATDVRFDQWDVFGSAVGSVEGKHLGWYYTYITADSIESNPSPISTPLIKANRLGIGVTVTASADAQVTGIHVYRTGGTLGAIYRVTSTPEANTTHEYVDTNTDDTLTALGLFLEADHDDPPAAAGAIAPYFGRALLYNTTANPNRFFWSEINRLHFPGSASVAGNWNDVGAAGEALIAATMHQGYINFYKTNQVWRLVGDPDDTSGHVDILTRSHGCTGPGAVCAAQGGDYFADTEGIYFLSGEVPQKISTKIDPIFKGQTVSLGNGVTIPPVSSSARAKIVMEYINGRLYVSYPASGSSSNDSGIIYHADSQRWYRDSRGLSCLRNESNVLLAGTPGGAVLSLEAGNADAGSAIAIAYQSKYYDCGAADVQKTAEDFVIECDAGATTLTITAVLDNGGSSVALGTVTGSGRQKFTKQFAAGLGQKFTNISFRVTGSASNEVVIYGMWLHYYPEARSAKSFDTDESDLGGPGVKMVRQIELDIDCTAANSLTLLSDLPGNAMASREVITVPLTSGRRIVAKMLSSEYRGYLFREVIDDGTAQFQLYGSRIQYKRIGTYVIANELWDSEELNFGSPKPKGMRALQIELENTAAVTVKVYSDLPGGALILRDTLTIPIGAARRVVQLPFAASAEYRGYNFKVTMSSTADWVLYSATAETRLIGTYISGSASKLYDSDELDFGTTKVKGMRALQVELDANTAAITVLVYSDLPGGTLALRDTLTIPIGATRRVLDIPFSANAEYRGRIFRLKLSSSADFILYDLGAETRVIGTYVFGGSGKIYDSDELDFGSTHPKGMRALQVELDANTAAITVQVYSDLPGGTLALRDTLTIPIGTTRRVLDIPFSANAEYRGRIFRLKLSSSADFILYDLGAETRVIGTYVFGGSGKLYDSGQLDFGTERLKWLKEVELDCEPISADCTLALLSDKPGSQIVARHSLLVPIGTVTGRRTAKIPIPATFQGKLHQYKVTSTADFILYEARVFIKEVGTPGATGWHWASLPLEPTQQGVWAWTHFPMEKTPEGVWAWTHFPMEQTAEGVWGWSGLPVLPTGSNDWQWYSFPMDRVA